MHIQKERFLVPAIVGNAPVRLSHRTQYDLAQYLLNYVGNYGAYHEESRNCQTFAADLVYIYTIVPVFFRSFFCFALLYLFIYLIFFNLCVSGICTLYISIF